MDNSELKEVRRIMCRHEEAQANNKALLLISSKITGLEQANAMQNANIMTLILLQKQWIDSLEVECNKLRSLVVSSRFKSLSLSLSLLITLAFEIL